MMKQMMEVMRKMILRMCFSCNKREHTRPPTGP